MTHSGAPTYINTTRWSRTYKSEEAAIVVMALSLLQRTTVPTVSLSLVYKVVERTCPLPGCGCIFPTFVLAFVYKNLVVPSDFFKRSARFLRQSFYFYLPSTYLVFFFCLGQVLTAKSASLTSLTHDFSRFLGRLHRYLSVSPI
ncbi:hypothetical protein F4775DRAFT_185932 [Biscogniauxia sp. FL1348]|nr:hypothetical protein F4775DRAFT_185932 [Biscogniauxia sp. FL1348]